jgi:hypothetical protein
MKSITIKDLHIIDNKFLLEIHTTSNQVFTCRKRFTCTTSTNSITDQDEGIGILGYIFPNETENEIYNLGLEMERSIPFSQIKGVYIKL